MDITFVSRKLQKACADEASLLQGLADAGIDLPMLDAIRILDVLDYHE